MIILLFLLLMLAILAANIAVIVLFLYHAAKKKQQASFVREATMEFVMAGERCIRVLENIKGWYYKKDDGVYKTKVGKYKPEEKNADNSIKTPAKWELEDKEITVKEAILLGGRGHEPENLKKVIRQCLRHKWGFYWVSMFYPQKHIHKFQVIKSRLRRNTEDGRKISEMIEVDAAPSEVDHLLWRFPRAVLVSDIEFADRLTAGLVVLSNFQVVMPNIPVFTYKADFFPQIESLVRSTVIDYCRGVKLADFIQTSPIGPTSSFFAQIISQVNPRMITQYGVEIESSWIVEIELGDSEEQKALRAKELAQLQGQAAVTKAKLDAKAVVATAQGTAEATVIKAKATAEATKLEGDAEAGVLKTKVEQAGEAVVIADLRRKGLEKFSGSVLNEGNASGGIMVSVPVKDKNQSQPVSAVTTPQAPTANPSTP